MIEKTLEWMYSLESLGSKLGLNRVNSLLEKLGNPQNKLRYVHVTGTNGKGSVCAMIESILRQEGYKIGLYTSPHLKRFNERIKVNGVEISDNKIIELAKKVKEYYDEQTFFEVTTAIAFLYFAEQKVDIVVLEVGMGGRLDATNVIIPEVSVITNISLEHTQVLGETEEKIAFEKAGIIKHNVPVVTLAKGKALEVIKKTAQEKNSVLLIPKVDRKLKLGLNGEFQYENAALALAAVKELKNKGYKISDNALKVGLEQAKWPGRMEFIEKNVLVDCAHNPAGISVLKKEIEKIRKNYGKIISIVSILKDKDREHMLKGITSFSDYIIFSKADIERATLPEELSGFVKVRNEIVYDPKHALKKAKKIANLEDLIVVTGSIYLVGEII